MLWPSMHAASHTSSEATWAQAFSGRRATKRVFWWPFGRKYRKKLLLLILGLSVFQQKDPISADIASFYRNHLFRFFRYFGRKSLFGDALFWLSADRRTFSLFCHPLLYSKYVSGEPCIRLGHYASAFPSQLTISSWAGANTPTSFRIRMKRASHE